jgi:hypothetical protein
VTAEKKNSILSKLQVTTTTTTTTTTKQQAKQQAKPHKRTRAELCVGRPL